jgi:F420-0:gamma-glutamyl ligase-like protein
MTPDVIAALLIAAWSYFLCGVALGALLDRRALRAEALARLGDFQRHRHEGDSLIVEPLR